MSIVKWMFQPIRINFPILEIANIKLLSLTYTMCYVLMKVFMFVLLSVMMDKV